MLANQQHRYYNEINTRNCESCWNTETRIRVKYNGTINPPKKALDYKTYPFMFQRKYQRNIPNLNTIKC